MKEAGVALQTFYRHFGGKDQLLVAVIADSIAQSCVDFAEAARDIDDPVERLHFYITSVVRSIESAPGASVSAQQVTVEHRRLHRTYPDEIATAIRPFSELLRREIEAAQAAGSLAPSDPEQDAWYVTQLVMTVFHHYAFASTDEPLDVIGEHLWQFCLAGLGGR